MSPTIAKIRNEVRHLPFGQRLRLVKELGHELDRDEAINSKEITGAWNGEIKKRLVEVNSGRVKLLSEEEFSTVFEEVRQDAASKVRK